MESTLKSRKKNHNLLWLALLLLFAFSQYNIFVTQREPWFDVSFTLETAHALQVNGLESIDFRYYDVHPPLFYYTLWTWNKFNPGLTEYHWGQELSVLLVAIFIIFAYLGLRYLFGRKGEWAAVLLMLCTTYIHYATEVRSYSLILAFSGFVFYGVVRDFEGVSSWALPSIMLFPMIHYISTICIPFYAVLYWVIHKDSERRVKTFWLILITGAIGIIMALYWAIPQRARTAGTWFQPPGILSFPSALFYAFFLVENSLDFTLASVLIFYGFLILLVILAIYGMFYMKRNMSRQERALYVMGLTALFPLAALAILQFGYIASGGNQFFALYHHRFFLVISWLFASMVFIVFQKFIEKKHYLKIFAIIALLFVLGLMQVNYANTVHHELENIMEQTPCPTGDQYSYIIGHESPFSSLPYKIYQREHGCNWVHFISTAISPKMSHSAGFDAVSEQLVFWNLTLPPFGFYYVESTAKEFPLDENNRTYDVIAEDDGIWLLYVHPAAISDIRVNFVG